MTDRINIYKLFTKYFDNFTYVFITSIKVGVRKCQKIVLV